jgi:hypothetical protein
MRGVDKSIRRFEVVKPDPGWAHVEASMPMPEDRHFPRAE